MFPIVAPVIIEEVGKGLPWRQFADLAVAQSGGHTGAEWLLAGQRRRLRTVAPPGGEAALLLARRNGRPVARLSAHCQEDGAASFGFLAVEGPGDTDAVAALVAVAAEWSAQWSVAPGSATLIGPLSWTAAEEAGVLTEGNERPAATGRAWNPPWYGDVLEAAGLEVAEERGTFLLPAADDGAAPVLVPGSFAVPADVGRLADPALLLATPDGEGSVVAVPDLAGGLSGGRRGAWSMASQARRRDWAGCVVTALDGPEEVLIPGLCAAAARAGYRWVLSPWAPDDRPPVMRHRLYRVP
jgi:hypothetical protein